MLGVRELLIILAIVLVVFGTKRLISAGGDIGKAIQSFRKGVRESQDEPAKLDPPAKPDAPGSPGSGSADGAAPGSSDRPQQDR